MAPMPKYRRKGFDIEIEAVQLTNENAEQVSIWADGALVVVEHDALDPEKEYKGLNVRTWEGNKRASEGDFVVKDLTGEFHVRRQGDFLSKYEEA